LGKGAEKNIWTKREKVTGGWRELHNGELHNFTLFNKKLIQKFDQKTSCKEITGGGGGQKAGQRMLKLCYRNRSVKLQIGFKWLRKGSTVGFCELNEAQSYLK
jgi:hypothetical protein